MNRLLCLNPFPTTRCRLFSMTVLCFQSLAASFAFFQKRNRASLLESWGCRLLQKTWGWGIPLQISSYFSAAYRLFVKTLAAHEATNLPLPAAPSSNPATLPSRKSRRASTNDPRRPIHSRTRLRRAGNSAPSHNSRAHRNKTFCEGLMFSGGRAGRAFHEAPRVCKASGCIRWRLPP